VFQLQFQKAGDFGFVFDEQDPFLHPIPHPTLVFFLFLFPLLPLSDEFLRKRKKAMLGENDGERVTSETRKTEEKRGITGIIGCFRSDHRPGPGSGGGSEGLGKGNCGGGCPGTPGWTCSCLPVLLTRLRVVPMLSEAALAMLLILM
jgi:hypothetical protein